MYVKVGILCFIFFKLNRSIPREKKNKTNGTNHYFLKLAFPWNSWVRRALCIFVPAHLDICLILFPVFHFVNSLVLVSAYFWCNQIHDTCVTMDEKRVSHLEGWQPYSLLEDMKAYSWKWVLRIWPDDWKQLLDLLMLSFPSPQGDAELFRSK